MSDEDTVDGAPSAPGVADPIQERMDAVRYPTWQPEARAVLLESDPTKVQAKLTIAEAAMAKRLKELSASEDKSERRALIEERQALELALDEIRARYPHLIK